MDSLGLGGCGCLPRGWVPEAGMIVWMCEVWQAPVACAVEVMYRCFGGQAGRQGWSYACAGKGAVLGEDDDAVGARDIAFHQILDMSGGLIA